MSDLIKRKDVAEFMFENRMCTSINNAYDQLQCIPTAYDVDKIVKEFDAKMKAVRSTKYTENDLQNIAIQTIINNVIFDLEQIVKR